MLSLLLISGSVVLACSAEPGDGNNGIDEPKAGSGGTTGITPGGPGIKPGGLGGGPGGPGGPPPGTGVVEDPPLTSCEAPKDCCDKIEGCKSADEYVCTVDGFCGVIRSSCTEQKDCQGDTYCCVGPDCLGTTATTGVCIPANVPPGAPCTEAVELGVFAPGVQCEWAGPKAGEPSPTSSNVSVTPLVANLPNRSGEVSTISPEGTSAELVIITWDADAAGSDGSNQAPGVIRILDGQNCTLLESIVDTVNKPRAISTPALADLDGDGDIEIVARRDTGGVVAYTWDSMTSAYKVMWAQAAGGTGIGTIASQPWDGVSIHDLNNDGKPEVLVRDGVYNGQTGAVIHSGGTVTSYWNGLLPTAADLDEDGTVELLGDKSGVWRATLWGWNGSSWAEKKALNNSGHHYAFADFGTEGATAGEFDPTTLDGIPEVVSISETGGILTVSTIVKSHKVMEVTTNDRGGPPNIGDFDGDGFPEIGIAGGTFLRVFDFDCETGCSGTQWVRWARPSKDASSLQTGATIFDFDGDGSAEVVYADECFLRVYRGTDGVVLYSNYRTSGTWYESPLVADIDQDQNTEIVVNNNYLSGATCTQHNDPIHPGIPCDTDAECPAASTCGEGYCRCSADTDCRGTGTLLETGLSCGAPVSPATGGNVCRSRHPGEGTRRTGIRVLRDSLDRWASSRSIWNQHNYSITNVNDDGTIPKTSDWKHNWDQPGMNNYRQNVQGEAGFSDLPDITGRFTDEESCVTAQGSSQVYVQATVCNRGKRAVGSELPATFYKGDPKDGQVLCTSYTEGPVPTGGCKLVYCKVGSDVAGEELTIVVNDDGNGGRSTVECRPDNNSDTTTVDSCSVTVVR